MNSDGSRVAIGAPYNDGNGTESGHVRVYEYASGAWTQLGSDIDGEAASDASGSSVSMNSDGSRVAIGAWLNDENGSNSGHVRVYLTNPGQVTFQPQTKEELQTAVNLWVSDNTTALSTYGEINTWDVSLITDMSDLFKDKSTFNDDISNWDVSNVTTMYQMFRFAGNFNQDLSSWDVSSVTNMRQIFRAAVKFTSDLSSWNVSNVTDMASTFQESRSFTSDLSSWDVSNVKKMHYMFAGASIFNGDISKWDVSSVTDMKYMFSITNNFNQDISGWDVSSVTNMFRMFQRAGSFNQDISGWNVSNVTDMNEMFGSASDASAMSNQNKCAIHTKFSSNANWSYDWSSSCITFQPKTREELQTAVDLWVSDNVTALSTYGEINTWDVSLITDMSDLFKDKSTFNGDISNWDVSNVTSFRQIFYGAKTFNQDISNWNVSGAKNMWRSFSHASSFNQDISNWNVSSVTNMYRMFDTAKTFNQDISNWDVSNVTRMYRMFRDAESFNQDISKWGSKLSKVTDMNGMFLSANTFNQDISNWDVSNVRDMESMFRFATSFNQDISGWNVSNVTNMKDMFGTASDANALSNQNKCAIHTSFQSNDAWPYVWSDSCPGLFKNKSPISLSPYPTSIESDDYTIDANGILDKPINWSFPAISDTGDIIDFIVGSDWHSKRPKDLQILYGKKVIATWTHPSKDSGGCAKDLDDYLQNGLTISASDCDTSTPSFSTGVLNMKLDISEADSLKLRILSAWEENGILFNGAWIRTGIYGHAESSALYVSALGSDLTGDGTSGNPFYTIQKGINHSKDGDSVLVYAGTYVENIDFTGKKISVIGENKFRTIIDGDSSGTVVTIESGEDSTTLLKAFMIRNGIAKNGGGIKITNKSNPVINHVIVHDNRSHTNGGGIYINNARASISNTIIRGNNSDGVAGGLYIGEGAEVTVSYAQIINNVAAVRGGGIFVRKHTTSFNLKYALISHNSSYEGGGIGSWYASSNLSNITFVGNNSTTNRGHAIFLRDGAQMVLENSIVMGTESNVIYLEDPESSLSATYSMIEKGWEGEGNIIADPLFCNLEIGNHISQLRNYSLWENSPCLGTGKDGANMGAFDMGCDSPKPFEWISSAVDTINLTTSNLTEIYKLEWAKSNNQFGDLHYKVYASIGSTPYDEIHDTTATNFPITYQEFLEGAFEPFPMLSSATVKFSVVAIEGTDTIKVTGGDRVVYVNRYEYLSTNSSAIPTKFALYENYPNPFNPTTTLRFDLPEVSDVSLVIYNMLGQKVRTFNMKSISAGTHSIKWNATNDIGESVSAGVYLYQFQAKGFVKNRKMVLLK